MALDVVGLVGLVVVVVYVAWSICTNRKPYEDDDDEWP
jgi:hypothetical protein